MTTMTMPTDVLMNAADDDPGVFNTLIHFDNRIRAMEVDTGRHMRSGVANATDDQPLNEYLDIAREHYGLDVNDPDTYDKLHLAFRKYRQLLMVELMSE
jgi:hypothetical protein